MSLGRSSRFCFLGPAKVKSEKVLSSFASASSIIVHHGGMLCCQDPWHGCWWNLVEYGNAQVLESTHKRYVLSSALTRIPLSFLDNAMTLFKQWIHSLLLSLSPVTRIIPSICILFPACTANVSFYHGSLPFPVISKNHPLRCLQQGNPHHPSPSMPFYRPPSKRSLENCLRLV